MVARAEEKEENSHYNMLEFLFRVIEMFLNHTVVMVVQHGEYTKNY
jgi:hypothetical protein